MITKYSPSFVYATKDCHPHATFSFVFGALETARYYWFLYTSPSHQGRRRAYTWVDIRFRMCARAYVCVFT